MSLSEPLCRFGTMAWTQLVLEPRCLARHRVGRHGCAANLRHQKVTAAEGAETHAHHMFRLFQKVLVRIRLYVHLLCFCDFIWIILYACIFPLNSVCRSQTWLKFSLPNTRRYCIPWRGRMKVHSNCNKHSVEQYWWCFYVFLTVVGHCLLSTTVK